MLIAPDNVQSAVSVSQVKTHLRVETHEDDALIEALAITATSMAEHELNRALVTQTLTLVIEEFPLKNIQLQKPPVKSVTSIKYLDTDGVLQTVSSDLYRLIKDPIAPYITSSAWPEGTEVTVVYQAGYGTESNVPAQIKQWILVHVGAMYENRESVGKELKPLPFVASLLDRYRTL
jgi:uncharacterized phiE125 gp8 family phage protein